MSGTRGAKQLVVEITQAMFSGPRSTILLHQRHHQRHHQITLDAEEKMEKMRIGMKIEKKTFQWPPDQCEVRLQWAQVRSQRECILISNPQEIRRRRSRREESRRETCCDDGFETSLLIDARPDHKLCLRSLLSDCEENHRHRHSGGQRENQCFDCILDA